MFDPKTCSSQVTSRVPNPFWLTIFRKAQMFEPKTCSSQVKEDFWIHFDNIRKLFKWKACNNLRASLATTGNLFVIAVSFFYIFLALNLYTLLVKIKCEFERFSLINLPFFYWRVYYTVLYDFNAATKRTSDFFVTLKSNFSSLIFGPYSNFLC
jgi:hypothetical protein